MLTGVIYGAIVVAWAAYLVPLALRRHDEASRSRSIERFSSAMRILARRGSPRAAVPGSTSRSVVTPKRDESRVVTPDPGPEPERVLVAPTRNRAAERAAAANRRRVLSLLVGACIGVGVVALLGWTPKWAPVVPLVLLVGFLVTARLSVRRARKPYWVDVPAAEQPPGVVIRRSLARVEASLGTEDEPLAEREEEGRNLRVEATGTPVGVATVATRGVAAAAQAPATSTRTPDGGSLWDPLPVTLPSYVGVPATVRTMRTIELSEPGPRTSVGGARADQGTPPRLGRPDVRDERASTPTSPLQAASPAAGGGDGDADDMEETIEIPRVVNA